MSKTSERPRKPDKTRSLNEVRAEVRERKPLPAFSPWMVFALFVVLDLIFHWSLIFGNKFLWEDFVEQEFPFRNLAATSLASGEIPHWNPYIFAGMPFTADIQAAFWYPTNLVMSLFVSDGYLSSGVMQFFILIHYAFAGFGMYLFAKKILDCDDLSAIFAGISYMFGGFIVAQAIHQMIVYHMALFPLVAYLFFRGFNDWKYALGAGLLMGIMYLGGHPQSTLFFTFFLGVAALYELTTRALRKHDGERLDLGVVLRCIVPVVVGLGIFAIQLLPSQELADLSRRDVITYEKSVEGSLSWGHLLTYVMPRLFGVSNAAQDATVPYWNGPYYMSWESALYIGVLPLFFALIGAALGWKRRYVPLLVGMSLFAILFALGENFFLYKIFFNLPLFDRFRTPARMVMVASFALAALAAVGLHHALLSDWKKRNSVFIAGGVLAGVWLLTVLGTFTASSFLPGVAAEANASINWAATSAALPVLALIGVVFLIMMGKFRGSVMAIGVIVITLIELFTYGQGLNASPISPEEQFRQQPELVELIKTEQAKDVNRARTRMGNTMLLKRNQGAYDRIQLIEGYNPLVLQRVSPETADPEAQADLMNMMWSITDAASGTADFQPRYTYIHRAKMYYKTEVRPDEQARALLKTDPTFDYRNVMLLEEQASISIAKEDPNPGIKMQRYSTDEIALEVTTAENGMLFLSEVYYPAWKAYVDDKPVKIFRAFTSLRAVEVPKGTHKVELRYESEAFATGSLITITTLILSLGALGSLIVQSRAPVRKSVSDAPSTA